MPMRKYLRDDYEEFESRPFVRDCVTEAFDAVSAHVTELEKRIKALEHAKPSKNAGGRGC
jgi:hypothetical protein